MAKNVMLVNPDERMITGPEAAKILNVSQNTVGRLFAKGEIAAIHVGSQWRTTMKALNDYVDSHVNWRD